VERSKVAELIGKEAEELTHLFCVVRAEEQGGARQRGKRLGMVQNCLGLLYTGIVGSMYLVTHPLVFMPRLLKQHHYLNVRVEAACFGLHVWCCL